MSDTMHPKITLYGATPSRASIVHWMLEELGEPYRYHRLNLMKGEHLKPEFLALNPMGKVPVVTDGDVVVSEVSAICCYLADTYPKAGLAPAIGDPLRGPYLKWLFFAPSCIEPAMMSQMFGWETANMDPMRRGAIGWRGLETVLDAVAAALHPGPHILGARFTAADVVIGSSLGWGMMFKGIPERPVFKEYVARLHARPAWQRYIAEQTKLTQAAQTA